MTTIHLGDCANGCATCAYNYHTGFVGKKCDTCQMSIEEEAVIVTACEECFHEDEFHGIVCGDDVAHFPCSACGQEFTIGTIDSWSAFLESMNEEAFQD